jgi:hypothetical protein
LVANLRRLGADGARETARAVNQQRIDPQRHCLSRGERSVPDVAYQELAELWEAVFGEQPSVVAEPSLTANILIRCLPHAPPYCVDVQGED